MPDLIDVLMDYMDRTRMRAFLEADGYSAAHSRAERRWDAFRRTLTPQQRACMQTLREQDFDVQNRELRAVFRAGLSLGLEWNRL